jgi:hypothetical protein
MHNSRFKRGVSRVSSDVCPLSFLSTQRCLHRTCSIFIAARGDLEARISPYRCLKSIDFVDKKQKKRLSDMHALMGAVETALKDRKIWKESPTVEDVNEMWVDGRTAIAVEPATGQGRKRRAKQMSWTNQLKLYRKRKSIRDEPEDEDEDEDE